MQLCLRDPQRLGPSQPQADDMVDSCCTQQMAPGRLARSGRVDAFIQGRLWFIVNFSVKSVGHPHMYVNSCLWKLLAQHSGIW